GDLFPEREQLCLVAIRIAKKLVEVVNVHDDGEVALQGLRDGPIDALEERRIDRERRRGGGVCRPADRNPYGAKPGLLLAPEEILLERQAPLAFARRLERVAKVHAPAEPAIVFLYVFLRSGLGRRCGLGESLGQDHEGKKRQTRVLHWHLLQRRRA